jgi:spermidine/putrescine transport system ATP-binding protein
MAGFDTAHGSFRARLAADAVGKPVKLYVRPEHTTLAKTKASENSVPVTITEVSFEGAFITVHGISESGKTITAEIRNDGSATVPEVGSKLHARFDAARASLLPDVNVRA